MLRSTTLLPLPILGAALTLACTQSAAAATVPFVEPGADAPRLTGATDREQFDVRIPTRWDATRLRLRLSITGSPELAAGSKLRVSIAGRALGVLDLRPGANTAEAELRLEGEDLAARDGSLPVVLESQLRTREHPCPAPDDLDAYAEVGMATVIEATGRWSSEPLQVRDLPGALVTGIGRDRSPLLVEFASEPTAESLRAAGVAAGEVAAAASSPLRLRVSTPSAPEAPGPREAVIRIEERAGVPELVVSGDGEAPRVRIAGSGDGLMRAAGALRPEVAATVSGGTIADPPALEIRRRPVPRRIPLASARVSGVGEQRLTSTFTIPDYVEVLRNARLRMGVTYSAPHGGNASIAINGRELRSQRLVDTGTTRFPVDAVLAGRGPALNRADILIGRNEVTIQADLRAERGACGPQAEAGTIATADTGSVTLMTRPRPVRATLAAYPFPLDRRPGWADTVVSLPADPTLAEYRAILSAVATARRATGEPAMPTYRIGGAVPQGMALILARPEAVPATLTKRMPDGLPAVAGTLGAVPAPQGTERGVQVVAVGPSALEAVSRDFTSGSIAGRIVQQRADGTTAVVLADANRVTGTQRGPVPWRGPLLILALAAIALFVVAIRASARRVRGDA